MQPLVVILGPTAAGKSDIAVEVALHCHGEVISADSVQLYRHFQIGSAQLSESEQRGVPHHLLGILEPDAEFSVARFQELARQKITEIAGRGKLPFLVGGTGLYIQAVVDPYEFPEVDDGLLELRQHYRQFQAEGRGEELYHELQQVDPVSAERLHPNDSRRVSRALEVYHLTGQPISAQPRREYTGSIYDPLLVIGITWERSELYRRIDFRVEQMFRNGLVEEVRKILVLGYSPELKPLQTLGYKQVVGYLQGEYDLETAISLTRQATRRFAKRQLTWFRRDPRVQWFDVTGSSGTVEILNKIIQSICRSIPFCVE
jgi:tRNA dimethylallyltransferase